MMESRRGVRHGYAPRNYPRPGPRGLASLTSIWDEGARIGEALPNGIAQRSRPALRSGLSRLGVRVSQRVGERAERSRRGLWIGTQAGSRRSRYASEGV